MSVRIFCSGESVAIYAEATVDSIVTSFLNNETVGVLSVIIAWHEASRKIALDCIGLRRI